MEPRGQCVEANRQFREPDILGALYVWRDRKNDSLCSGFRNDPDHLGNRLMDESIRQDRGAFHAVEKEVCTVLEDFRRDGDEGFWIVEKLYPLRPVFVVFSGYDLLLETNAFRRVRIEIVADGSPRERCGCYLNRSPPARPGG